MKITSDLIFKILIFLFFPLFFLLTFWWVSFLFIKEKYIYLFVIFGFLVGLVINSIFFKKFIKNLYILNIKFIIIIYLFYNFSIFGFFMGIPIFNLIMSFISGLYFGKRCKILKLDKIRSINIIKRVAVFTTIFIFIIFCISGFIAIKDPFTVVNIQGMLNLKNPLTKNMIYIIVIFGGILLLIVNYYLTKYIGIKEFNKIS